ncbi:MAG TPA: tetratricopeptide repeat protein [Dokdonella sp.]|uniref:tetratricopeptide repeat protein n=1 Tax=Dokdonella sp. TaxID=2291710 RepID=UPI002D7E6C82|nr:tetratricopeptide repeat protein [Dokdonella sp.]HET9031490.1 tetratricopeptide repeat protein [Dokdonella sp.]
MERSLLRDTWEELKRRRVVRAGITYAVVGWVVLQAAEVTFEPLNLPPWAMTWTVLGVVLGFPVVLVLSWFFDVSRRGITREHGVAGAAGAAFAVATVLLAVAGVAWWLYGVYAPTQSRLADASTSADSAANMAPPNSIGVLPFNDLSPGADQGFLADGIAEELLDRLARNDSLQVAARTSSFALRGLAQDMRALGRQLGVRWLLEGSLRKAEGRVRVTAQLIDTRNGFHVWSDTYERSDQDLFALQDEVAVAIADELSSRIKGVVAQAPTEADTTNSEALQAYLQGRQAWRQRTADSLQRAESLFRKAVELDPDFARAWSGLADTYLLQAGYGRRSEQEAIQLAEPAAVNAVVLRPKSGEAWASLGLLRMTAGQYKAAQNSLEQAMSLDPHYEMAPMWLATVYANMGQVDKRREVLMKAVELNPLEPVINVNLAEMMANSGDRQGARELLQRVLAITPNEASLLRAVSGMELSERRYVEAMRAARKALATDPDGPANIHAMLRVLLQIEDFDAAAALANRLPEDTQDRHTTVQRIAFSSGGTQLLPAMEETIVRIAQSPYSINNSKALTLGGVIELRAGNPRRAVEWLGRAAGSPEQLESHFDLMDPASLLVVALQQLGETKEAERWSQPLQDASSMVIEHGGNAMQRYMVEAMVAMHDGDTQAAVVALNAAYDKGYRERWQLLYDPRLAPLQKLPEMRAMQQRMADEFAAAREEISQDRGG